MKPCSKPHPHSLQKTNYPPLPPTQVHTTAYFMTQNCVIWAKRIKLLSGLKECFKSPGKAIEDWDEVENSCERRLAASEEVMFEMWPVYAENSGVLQAEEEQLKKKSAAWSLMTRMSACVWEPLSKRSTADEKRLEDRARSWMFLHALRVPRSDGLFLLFHVQNELCEVTSRLPTVEALLLWVVKAMPWFSRERGWGTPRHSVTLFSLSKVRNTSTKPGVGLHRAVNNFFFPFGLFARNASDSRILSSYSWSLSRSKIHFQFLMLSWMVFMASQLEKNENECTIWKIRFISCGYCLWFFRKQKQLQQQNLLVGFN